MVIRHVLQRNDHGFETFTLVVAVIVAAVNVVVCNCVPQKIGRDSEESRRSHFAHLNE